MAQTDSAVSPARLLGSLGGPRRKRADQRRLWRPIHRHVVVEHYAASAPASLVDDMLGDGFDDRFASAANQLVALPLLFVRRPRRLSCP